MHVRHMLIGGRAIVNKNIVAITGNTGSLLGHYHRMGDLKKVAAQIDIKFFNMHRMHPGNHQCVAEIHGKKIHKGHGMLVFIDNTGGRFSIHDLTENAVTHRDVPFCSAVGRGKSWHHCTI